MIKRHRRKNRSCIWAFAFELSILLRHQTWHQTLDGIFKSIEYRGSVSMCTACFCLQNGGKADNHNNKSSSSPWGPQIVSHEHSLDPCRPSPNTWFSIVNLHNNVAINKTVNHYLITALQRRNCRVITHQGHINTVNMHLVLSLRWTLETLVFNHDAIWKRQKYKIVIMLM